MLRIWGEAELSRDPALLERTRAKDKLPPAVLVVRVTKVYFHCGKAVIRSRLWDAASQAPAAEFPSFGQVIKDQARVADSAAELQADMDDLYRERLY